MFPCPYPLLHVKQLLTGGDGGESYESRQGLASLCHQGLPLDASLGLALTLLDQPLQQGEVSIQQHPLQLPAHLTTAHALTHTLGSQHRYAEAFGHRDRSDTGFSEVLKCLFKLVHTDVKAFL